MGAAPLLAPPAAPPPTQLEISHATLWVHRRVSQGGGPAHSGPCLPALRKEDPHTCRRFAARTRCTTAPPFVSSLLFQQKYILLSSGAVSSGEGGVSSSGCRRRAFSIAGDPLFTYAASWARALPNALGGLVSFSQQHAESQSTRKRTKRTPRALQTRASAANTTGTHREQRSRSGHRAAQGGAARLHTRTHTHARSRTYTPTRTQAYTETG